MNPVRLLEGSWLDGLIDGLVKLVCHNFLKGQGSYTSNAPTGVLVSAWC